MEPNLGHKEKYQIFCQEENNIPIFSQAWWLDTVCGNENWNVLLHETNGKIDAVLPYFKPVFIMPLITQPLLTPYNGVYYFLPGEFKQVTRHSFEKKICEEFIEKINEMKLGFYMQSFHYSFTNWLPFYWQGFHQTTRYSYRFNDLSNIEEVWRGLDKGRRNTIRHARKLIKIVKSDDLIPLYLLNRKNFLDQNKPLPFSYTTLKNIDYECSMRNCRQLKYAVDHSGNIHAAIYVIWDYDCMYYLLSGVNSEFRSSGAGSLLVWDAIRRAAEMGKKFDFEGSMIEPIENFISSFGAIGTPYFKIWKASPGGWPLYYGYKALQQSEQWISTYNDRQIKNSHGLYLI